tara:strand:+ start:42 stop:1316 length:1275 start_codon:yes stop_codon:yes gene_type:complete
MATATSKISPVITRSGRASSSSTYIATKVTGPDKNNQYTSEIIQYDNAKGDGAKTIGTRDPETGNITWNNNASRKIKSNENKFKKASNNQIESVQKDLATTAEQKQGLNASSGKANQDNTDGNTDSTDAKATPAPRNLSGGWDGSDTPIGRSNDARNTYGNHCYPIAMRTNLKDNIKISVIKHEPRAISGLAMADRPPGSPIGSVILPMPSAIQDGNKVSWGSETMTPLQMATSGAVKAFLGDSADAAIKQANESVQAMQTGGGSEALENFFTEQLTGAENLLSRTTGQVMNPNMELLFKGPSLRTFSFTWKMSPRDQKESIEIGKIIRMFKQSMAPQQTPEQLFLKAPNIYQLTLRSGGDRNKFLPKMKTCALLDCAVNYTPDGSFMAYDNDSMVAYEMALSFQEIEPIYNNDYSMTDDSVGY